MSVSRIAARYAKSLIDLAIERGQLGMVIRDIKSLSSAVKNRDLYLMFKSPIILPDKKKQITDTLFGDRFSTLTMAFLRICITKGRESLLPEIAEEAMAMHKQMQSLTTIKITTATPLTEQGIEDIRRKFELSGSTGKTVDVQTAVNPDLIGGFVVEFGDKLYDASVAHQLDNLRKTFMDGSYDKKL
jgi:F-type H+-transporting ATPase subunit delta